MSGNGRYEAEEVLRENSDLLREAEQLTESPDREVGAEILEDIIEFIHRYMLVTVNQAIVLAVWILHCFVFYLFDFKPFLIVTSPEKRCGKSRCLDILEILVPRPWKTSHATIAALARRIHRIKPALMIDEFDALLHGPKEQMEMMRGLLDDGDKRGAVRSVLVQKGKDWCDKDLYIYCPKAFAGLSEVSGTLADRGLQIRLERKQKTDRSSDFATSA